MIEASHVHLPKLSINIERAVQPASGDGARAEVPGQPAAPTVATELGLDPIDVIHRNPVGCKDVEHQRDCLEQENGEDMGVFIKNAENVQGDERDIIVFSTAIGQDQHTDGRLALSH